MVLRGKPIAIMPRTKYSQPTPWLCGFGAKGWMRESKPVRLVVCFIGGKSTPRTFERYALVKVLDLFSGIGMYALGAEQAGHEVIGFCEKDVWARKILKKHWPMKPSSSCIKLLNRVLTASLAARRVKIIRLQINPGKVSMESVRDSSGKWCEPFAWYDQNYGCWRTFQQCLQGGFTEWSGVWPAAGMTRNGIAYRRTPTAHPTTAPESMLLPTPAARDGRGSSKKRHRNNPNSIVGATSDVLRISPQCPPCTHPNFAEAIMGLPKDYTALETETHHVLSES